MHGHMLTKDVAVANPQAGGLAGIFKVLGRPADNTARIKTVVRTDGRLPSDIDVWTDDTMRAKLHAFINDRVRSDLDGRVQFCLRMDNGSWMNHAVKSEATRQLAKSKLRTTNQAWKYPLRPSVA